MNTLLCDILRFGFFGGDNPVERHSVDEGMWQRLFEESRKEAVTALLYDAILKLPPQQRPPKKILFHFTSYTSTVETDGRRRECVLKDFLGLVKDSLAVSPILVKGISLAQYYPEPLHRECGDNDLYTGDSTQAISSFFESKGLTVDRKDPRHDTLSYHEVLFELHHYLLYRNDDIRWTGVSMSLGDGSTLLHLPPEQEAFFVANHIEYRTTFFNEAVRLRSLLDWSMLVTSKGFDFGELNRIKKGTDVDVFVDLLTNYCMQLFGLKGLTVPELPTDKCLTPDDFYRLFIQVPERHPWALVRVCRRTWKYLRYNRKYHALYGKSMFRRFYFKNLGVAIKQHV